MIVVDASLVLDLLVRTPAVEPVRQYLLSGEPILQCPHLLDVEVAQALRRLTRLERIRPVRAAEALEDLSGLGIVRWPHQPFLKRIWELRGSLTAYDAAYVALAEALGALLLTRDAHLASTKGHRARIEVV